MSALNMEEFPRGQISTSPQNSEKELKISKNGTHCEMKKSGKQIHFVYTSCLPSYVINKRVPNS